MRTCLRDHRPESPVSPRGRVEDMRMEVVFCELPDRLHPASAYFLHEFTVGRISEAYFLRSFSLPNSDYIPLGECLVSLFRALGVGV